ncbi:MAG TPA: hypothetical protein VHM91_03520 [Verrucomicrobiales bacterium]|jgi:hypothetical protein|nr:hypothetical protein [Verrucomicrobiales bacterium]
MTTTLFFAFIAVMLAIVVALFARCLRGRHALIATAGLIVWLIYVGLIGYFGLIRNVSLRPPGFIFLFAPLVALLVLFAVRIRSVAGTRCALLFPLWAVLLTQSFRVIVELFLHRLWIEGLIPRMLTYSGANVDLYIGASAPLVAWISTRGRSGIQVALIWNVLGLLALANVVIRALLTAPGPLNLIHAEVPNLMIGTFPYMFIPGFFVLLAVALHVLAIRIICATNCERHAFTRYGEDGA